MEVHPHGRGEKFILVVFCVTSCGSPPRAWGKVVFGRAHPGRSGFTPTGVGKSPRPKVKSFFKMVHPHGRGEKNKAKFGQKTGFGSPPRAWGKVYVHRWTERPGWFTPTGVGKSTVKRGMPAVRMVHPHGRGEKETASHLPVLLNGSPPRAWGKGPG